MQLELPIEALDYLCRQATVAGFVDATEYLLTLIEQDQTAKRYAESLASDQRLERLALEGIESGDAGTMTSDDWADLRNELASRIEKRSQE
jgi:hypothetical protein